MRPCTRQNRPAGTAPSLSNIEGALSLTGSRLFGNQQIPNHSGPVGPEQIGLDKGIQVAVKDRIHIAYLVVGAVVLNHFIRVKNVAPYLAAPFYFFLAGVGCRNYEM